MAEVWTEVQSSGVGRMVERGMNGGEGDGWWRGEMDGGEGDGWWRGGWMVERGDGWWRGGMDGERGVEGGGR